MGRRSINTTKSGKYMNPTDQARKEARKRELKKNKKQRQMVRAAVLKGKDPLQLISDMEKIDEMEFNVNSPPLLNEKVLKDKRKKLKETWDRVMRLYYKEDRERYNELKKLELEYEGRRNILVKYYESVRIAQQVQVDEIPLPDTPEMPEFLTSQIPLPSEMDHNLEAENVSVPHSILKKTMTVSEKEPIPTNFHAPGVPPGPIPDLSSDEETEDEIITSQSKKEEETVSHDTKSAKSRKIRFADEKEDESDNEIADDKNDDTKDTDNEVMDTSNDAETLADKHRVEDIPIPPMPQSTSLPPGPPPRLPQGPPPNVQVMYRPPPIRTHIPPPPRMLPPGVPPPPPGRPTLPPPGLPIRLGAPPIRLPPGPPPGMPPPRLLRPPSAPPPRISTVLPSANVPPPGITSTTTATSATAAANVTVLSAPPSLMQRPKGGEDDAQRSATIEAKPQIRNLSADVMRFMPTTLRIKREDRQKKGGTKTGTTYDHVKDNYPSAAPVSNANVPAPTKDDAYMQFLREMEELL
ncbi:WW domain-binding protein 11 [Araneus ventricosus]|uniref:WW domain-binding protein 11 n=1 Tax=Araneus ventricosus TaxID=182803 RepID=A0A4Y2FFP5_ARAVE|nr:WW domain-binding protein 11 [Araneus ventricosus]